MNEAFGSTTVPPTLSQTSINEIQNISVPMNIFEDGLTAIASSTTVESGDNIVVSVIADPGVVLEEVAVIGWNIAESSDVPPFDVTVPIPVEALGQYELLVIGRDINGDFYTAQPLLIDVQTPAGLVDIRVTPSIQILLGTGDSSQLFVFGEYADGVTRQIPANQVTWLSSTSSIVSVNANGVVTANSLGSVTVVGQFGGLQDSITAQVLVNNLTPTANAGPDQVVPVGSAVTLDGTGSFDPDNGPLPLAYEWAQISGPTVSLSSFTGATPNFTADVEDVYVFALVVRDGQADSAPDSVTITVGDVAPTDPADPGEPGAFTPLQPEDLGVFELPATGERPRWAEVLRAWLGGLRLAD